MSTVGHLLILCVVLAPADVVPTSQPAAEIAETHTNCLLLTQQEAIYKRELQEARRQARELYGPVQESLRRSAAQLRESTEQSVKKREQSARERRKQIRGSTYIYRGEKGRRDTIEEENEKLRKDRADRNDARDGRLEDYGKRLRRAVAMEKAHVGFATAEIHARWRQDRFSYAAFRGAVTALRQASPENPCNLMQFGTDADTVESQMWSTAARSIQALAKGRPAFLGTMLTDHDRSLRAVLESKPNCIFDRRTGLRKAIADLWGALEQADCLTDAQRPIASWWLSEADSRGGSARAAQRGQQRR